MFLCTSFLYFPTLSIYVFVTRVRYTCILLFLHYVVFRSQLRTIEIVWPSLFSHCNLYLYICMYVCMYSEYFSLACMFVCLVNTSVLPFPKIGTNCLPRCVGKHLKHFIMLTKAITGWTSQIRQLPDLMLAGPQKIPDYRWSLKHFA